MADVQTACVVCGAILGGIDLLDRVCARHRDEARVRDVGPQILVKSEVSVTVAFNPTFQIEIRGNLNDGTLGASLPPFAPSGIYPAVSGIVATQVATVSGGTVVFQPPR